MNPRDDLRDQVVGGMLADIVDALERSKAVYEPSEHEMAVVRGLAEAAFRSRPVDPLSLNYRQLGDLAEQGRAANEIAEAFPAWPARPDKPLADLLKVAGPQQVDRVHGLLRRLGQA